MNFNFEAITHDTRGLAVNEYGVAQFYIKLAEKLLYAHTVADRIAFNGNNYVLANEVESDIAEEVTALLEAMDWCATRIKALGLPDEKVAELLEDVNNFNQSVNKLGARSI